MAKITDYRVFHNHLSVDLVESIMGDKRTKKFYDLTDKIIMETFKFVAKNNSKNLIFTFCYDYPDDNKHIKKVIKIIEKYRGDILFVHLTCDKDKLRKRTKETSRKKYGKIKDIKILNDGLSKWNLFTPIPFVDNLEIDNTKISAKDVAKKIKEYYKL